ncbi:MAG TPA: site-specific integrase [Flavitalea sp.]|nr:site-specific integrase [Flavitalea sp.]
MEIFIKPVLWTYRRITKGKKNLVEGEYGVRIRMTQARANTYISISFSSSLKEWDNKNNYPRLTHPKYKEIAVKIDKIIDDIQFEIKLAERAGRYLTPKQIKAAVTNSGQSFTKVNKPHKILAYIQTIIDQYEDSGNPGYANIFRNCKVSIQKLLNNKDCMFVEFTKAHHEAYERQLSKKSESTKSIYLRTLYRVWNLAIADEIVTKEYHPKRHIKFKVYKRIRTKKRSIKSSYFQSILKLSFPEESREYRSHLLLQFMYYARGINFNDMLKLKSGNIQNNGLIYKRSKNKRDYNFEMHPKAIKIVNTFLTYPVQSDAGYIFPFIFQTHDTARKIHTRIKSALKDFNEDAKVIANTVGWEIQFTSNSLRHCFASHLNEADVGIRIIQEALGHETQLQTQTYLDDIDDSIVTEAINNALL